MALHSSTLAWKIPWTEEPGRLQSMGSQKVGHDWTTSLSLFTFMHWRRKWQPTSVFLPRESCGQKSLVGCCPWCRQSQTRLKRLSMHACIREGNGSPLQCSCLENPRDRGPWWAAVCGVEQSRTRLKRLSSSSMVFPAGLSWSFSIRHVRMWELGHKEGRAPKNWCFQTVLEKILESPLDCKEIKPVKPKGNQPSRVIGRTDVEAEAPVIWPPDGKSWFIGKDLDAGKDWRQEEKGMTEDAMVGWHHWLKEHESEQTPRDGEGQGSLECCSPWVPEWDMTWQLNNNDIWLPTPISLGITIVSHTNEILEFSTKKKMRQQLHPLEGKCS